MRAKIRKLATFVEETCTEIGRAIQPPTRRAACVAVIENPCAGKYVEDLTELMDIGEELGELLTQRAVAALGISGNTVESYGKAAAVGENGELEHAAAVLHPKLGAPVRKVLGKGAALIPSSKIRPHRRWRDGHQVGRRANHLRWRRRCRQRRQDRRCWPASRSRS